jgi:hypothetical protein
MKLLWFIALPLIAQESLTDRLESPSEKRARNVGTVVRLSNPPLNIFEIRTKSIAELGRPICIERVVIRARLFDGDRNGEGDIRFVEKTYVLQLIEQHNGITERRAVDLGRGRVLTWKVEAYPLMNDFICGTKWD